MFLQNNGLKKKNDLYHKILEILLAVGKWAMSAPI